MTLKIVVDGVEREMTPEEEAAMLADWADSNALPKVRAAQWERIKAIRDRRKLEGGYKVVVAAVDKWFHSDTFSRTQQLGLVIMGAGVPAIQWRTMDGSFVTMSQVLAGQIFAAAATSDATLFAYAEALHAAVEAAEDPNAVDIHAGWPAIFEE